MRSRQHIRRGTFIIEYVGEVLDSAELDFRMSEARRTAEQHFYIMELDPGGSVRVCGWSQGGCDKIWV